MLPEIDSIAQQLANHINHLVGGNVFSRTGKRVLIASSRYDKIGSPIEVLIGLALAQRQADVQFLLCDQVMLACDARRIDRDNPEFCVTCWTNGQHLFNSTGLPVFPFSQWLQDDDIEEIEQRIAQLSHDDLLIYQEAGIQLGNIAYASTLRHYLRSSLNTFYHFQKFQQFLVTAILVLRLMTRMLEQLKPEAIFISHGIYVTWGILTEFASSHGIPVIVYGYGYRKGTILLAVGRSYHDELVVEPVDLWKNSLFSNSQERLIRHYLSSRANGGLDWIRYNTAPPKTRKQLKQYFNLQPKKKIFALFTNLAWDAAVVFHNTAFPDMKSWLIATIEWAINQHDCHLIVRCHPAEANLVVQTQEKATDIILNAFPQLPEHIHIIPAEAEINTYDLTQIVDVALVYTTKVGLEFVTRNIPVIVAGEAFYRNKGFTYDPTSVVDYFNKIETISHPIPNQETLSLRYAYHYFFRRYVELHHLADGGIGQPVLSLAVESLTDLNLGMDTHLDTICNTILKGSPPLAPDPIKPKEHL